MLRTEILFKQKQIKTTISGQSADRSNIVSSIFFITFAAYF